MDFWGYNYFAPTALIAEQLIRNKFQRHISQIADTQNVRQFSLRPGVEP
jgi:hypothetical protein